MSILILALFVNGRHTDSCSQSNSENTNSLVPRLFVGGGINPQNLVGNRMFMCIFMSRPDVIPRYPRLNILSIQRSTETMHTMVRNTSGYPRKPWDTQCSGTQVSHYGKEHPRISQELMQGYSAVLRDPWVIPDIPGI